MEVVGENWKDLWQWQDKTRCSCKQKYPSYTYQFTGIFFFCRLDIPFLENVCLKSDGSEIIWHLEKAICSRMLPVVTLCNGRQLNSTRLLSHILVWRIANYCLTWFFHLSVKRRVKSGKVLLWNLSFVPKVLLLLSLMDRSTCFVSEEGSRNQCHPNRTVLIRFSPFQEKHPVEELLLSITGYLLFLLHMSRWAYHCNLSLLLFWLLQDFIQGWTLNDCHK